VAGIVTRRVDARVEFHDVDAMGVAHNARYLLWFEMGRLALLEEVLPLRWALERRIAAPVVASRCEHLAPAGYGDALAITTRHRKADRWGGRFAFEHSVSNRATKVELCRGSTEITVVDAGSGRPLRDLPPEVWERYLGLT